MFGLFTGLSAWEVRQMESLTWIKDGLMALVTGRPVLKPNSPELIMGIWC